MFLKKTKNNNQFYRYNGRSAFDLANNAILIRKCKAKNIFQCLVLTKNKNVQIVLTINCYKL